MGQKVNPVGLRVTVTKDWLSKWYADKREFGGLLNLSNRTVFYYLCLALLLATVYGVWRVVNSRFGQVIQGSRSNDRRMRAIGFPTFRYKLTCFVIAGVLFFNERPTLRQSFGVLCAFAGMLLLPRRAFLLPVVFLCAGVARMAIADAHLDATLARLPPRPATTRLIGVVDEPPRREGDAPAAVVRILAASPAWPKEARVALRLPLGSVLRRGPTEIVARITRDTAELERGFSALTSKALAQLTKGIAAFAAAHEASDASSLAMLASVAHFSPASNLRATSASVS